MREDGCSGLQTRGAKKRRETRLQLMGTEGSGTAREGRKKGCSLGGGGQEECTVGAEGRQELEGREHGGQRGYRGCGSVDRKSVV